MRRFVATMAALATVAAPALAAPKKKDAKAAFDRGVAAYQKEDYDKAATELGKSYDLEPDVETLYAWAQAERQLDDCDKASELYRKLLGYDLPEENKDVIREKLEECRKILEPDRPEGGDDPQPIPGRIVGVEQPEPAYQPPPRERRKTWWKDPVGDALVGTGFIAAGVGLAFYFSASNANDRSGVSYPDYAENSGTAESRGKIGTSLMFGGGALVVIGIARYTLFPARETVPVRERRATPRKPPSSDDADRDDESAQLAPWFTPSGAGVAAFGRF